MTVSLLCRSFRGKTKENEKINVPLCVSISSHCPVYAIESIISEWIHSAGGWYCRLYRDDCLLRTVVIVFLFTRCLSVCRASDWLLYWVQYWLLAIGRPSSFPVPVHVRLPACGGAACLVFSRLSRLFTPLGSGYRKLIEV